jgi:2,3-dihydroxybiphenyl 1,2-dioxygenase
MMDRVCVTELGYIGIAASDLGAWRAFAGEVLGMECIDEDGGVTVRMDYWHHRILIRPGPDDDLSYAGYRVSGPDEFGMMQRHLAANNVPFDVASREEAEAHHVLEFLRLADPAGIPIEVFHGPRVDRHRPFRPGRGMHGRFSTASGGIGHLIIRDAGVEASYRFYRDILGMRGSVEARYRMGGEKFEPVFMHCNEREHTVAFGVGRLTKRIHHLMVEVDNQDDVGLAYDLAKVRKAPILIEPGKHSNDEMFSFYVRTPSGWYCEYGHGGSRAKEQSEYNIAPEIWGHELQRQTLTE